MIMEFIDSAGFQKQANALNTPMTRQIAPKAAKETTEATIKPMKDPTDTTPMPNPATFTALPANSA